MAAHDMRLGRLFDPNSGRSFVVAFDRGLVASARPGGERALQVIETLTRSSIDGLLLGPGLAARGLGSFAHRHSPQLLIRCDLLIMSGVLPDGLTGPAEEYRMLIRPEEAAALGADVVVLFLVLGQQDPRITADNAKAVAKAVHRAHAVGLPVMVEAVLWGPRIKDPRDPANLAFVCRQAAEFGADVIKTQYTGDVQSMRDVLSGVPVPVMALGGPRTDALADAVEISRQVVRAGASGVVFGRNIWQADDPVAAAAAVSDAVHGDLAAR